LRSGLGRFPFSAFSAQAENRLAAIHGTASNLVAGEANQMALKCAKLIFLAAMFQLVRMALTTNAETTAMLALFLGLFCLLKNYYHCEYSGLYPTVYSWQFPFSFVCLLL
jgi:hypothetical protein